MKIMNITDTQKFFEVVDGCKGKVELITSEGDRLNLKSKLCQFVSLTKIFDLTEKIDIELICEDPQDTLKLLDYVVNK